MANPEQNPSRQSGSTGSMGVVVGKAWKGWWADSGQLLAAGLAFFGALAASPLVIIAAAASLQFGGKAVTARDVFDPIASVVGPTAAGTVAKTVTHSPAASGGSIVLQGLALGFAIFAATGLFLQFRTILDIVFGLDRPTDYKGWLGDLGHAFAAVAGIGAVVVATGLASRFATSIVPKPARPVAVTSVRVVAILVLACLVPVAYRYLARHRVAWSAAIAGSVVAIATAAAVTMLAWFYFNTGTATKVYGPAASMFVALIWLLMIGSGVVAGAEFACAWQAERGTPKSG